jgi:hypothetical protein
MHSLVGLRLLTLIFSTLIWTVVRRGGKVVAAKIVGRAGLFLRTTRLLLRS